jgi:curli biogenesis system outer membrane secretion channel CsgG
MKSLLVLLMFAVPALAASKIPVSVTQFTNEAASGVNAESGCYYYSYFNPTRLGSALQERLIAELVKDGRFMVLERKTIEKIYYGEHELINSAKSKNKIEKGQFRQAKYTMVGVVKSFELCSGGEGASLDVGRLIGFGSLNVGAKRSKASVEVEIRLIETRTGEVLRSEEGSAEKTSTSLGLSGNIRNVSLSGSQFRNSLLGKAVDEAIRNAASEILKTFEG